ncbi:MAG: hypothetical protein Q8O55_01665 [Dehalococcoidales bacterium]|nr:hypothetical protein [Dehalococcoidales bacterium]
MVAVDYTPNPQVEGEILQNNGQRALVVQYRDDGSMRLLVYEWKQDKRRRDRKGSWSVAMFGTLDLTLAERVNLNQVFK